MSFYVNKILFWSIFGTLLYGSAIIKLVNSSILCDPLKSALISPSSTAPNISCLQTRSVYGIHSTFDWSNGQSSNIIFDVVISANANGIDTQVLNGSVTSGLYASASFTNTCVFPDITTDCLTSEGVTQLSGIGVGLIGLNPINCSYTLGYSPGITYTPNTSLLTFQTNCTVWPLLC